MSSTRKALAEINFEDVVETHYSPCCLYIYTYLVASTFNYLGKLILVRYVHKKYVE